MLFDYFEAPGHEGPRSCSEVLFGRDSAGRGAAVSRFDVHP